MTDTAGDVYVPDDTLPPIGRAVSLALAVMKAAKVGRWSDLNGRIPDHIRLLPGQLDLLRGFLDVIGYLRVKSDAVAATTSLLLCRTCERWVLTNSSGSISTCQFTRHCTGQVVRVGVAQKAKA